MYRVLIEIFIVRLTTKNKEKEKKNAATFLYLVTMQRQKLDHPFPPPELILQLEAIFDDLDQTPKPVKIYNMFTR